MRLPIGIAGLHLRMARFAEARRWVALTEDAPETPVGVFMIVWGALVRAVSAWQEDDLAAAERAARAGIAAAPGRFFFTKRQLADLLARTLLAEGRVDEARIAAAEDRRRLELAGAVGLLPGLEALEAEIALAAGDRAAARRWADAATPPFLPDPVRMVDHSALAQARIWLDRDAPGDAARAAALLARLRDHQAATHHALGQLRTLPLLAAAQEAAGDRIAARETMRAALEHERGATPRRFADAGSRAAALLAGIAADEADPLADPATRVLAALGEDDGQPLPAGPSPLTDRQREILAMVAEMRTNKEIGEALGITPVTARDHLRRIFARLDVGDRRSAVEVARAAGWL